MVAVTKHRHVKKLILSELHVTIEIPKFLYQNKWCTYSNS
jgi:hypothetical protein